MRRTTAISRSEEHTSELQSRGLISYAVFCLKKTFTVPSSSCRFRRVDRRSGAGRTRLARARGRAREVATLLSAPPRRASRGSLFFLNAGAPPDFPPLPLPAPFQI